MRLRLPRSATRALPNGLRPLRRSRARQPDIAAWFARDLPIVVADDVHTGVVAFASASSYNSRPCYAGIAEFSVYVARASRGHGAGDAVLRAFTKACAQAGLHKLTSRMFPENAASRALLERCGFAEIGFTAGMDGIWRDCVIVELLLGVSGP